MTDLWEPPLVEPDEEDPGEPPDDPEFFDRTPYPDEDPLWEEADKRCEECGQWRYWSFRGGIWLCGCDDDEEDL